MAGSRAHDRDSTRACRPEAAAAPWRGRPPGSQTGNLRPAARSSAGQAGRREVLSRVHGGGATRRFPHRWATLGGQAGPSRSSARRAVTYGRMPVNDEQPAQSGSAGGAATHKGMWYQALWCVLQAARARLDASDSGLRLVLEPLGGDAWLERTGHRRVVQLKTAYRGTWSLKEVVEEVLPDLYRAVASDEAGSVTYEFVTEGRLGRWRAVLSFFETLGGRSPRDATAEAFNAAYERLDNDRELDFGGSSGAFWGGGRTERRVFDRIVEFLREDGAAATETPVQQVRLTVWHLLANFKFVGDVREERLRSDLEAMLLRTVEHRETLESIRNALVGHLFEKSRQNEAAISPAELLESVGLKNVVAIGRDVILRERCCTQVSRLAQTWGYHADWDVRTTGLDRSPIVAVTGESGHGKTWRLCAQIRKAETPGIVLLRSTGDLHTDLRRAADEVWKGALGHEMQADVRSISARRADTLGTPRNVAWLTIAIDQLGDAEQANALLDEPLEDWGVRVIVTCNPATAAVFEQYDQQRPGRVRVFRVGPFGVSERNEYLRRRIGDEWVMLPEDVRQLLRSPQLAGMYCDIWQKGSKWEPQNEYELIEKYWKRLTTKREHSRDGLRLRQLAGTVLVDAPYPWDDLQIEELRIDEDAMSRMVAAGWLRADVDGRYEMSHHRLLNFAVAQHLAMQHRNHVVKDAELAELLGSMMNGSRRFSGQYLGYVPMDWFFIRGHDPDGGTLPVLRLLRDVLDHQVREALYRELLPTLGADGLPLLWDSFVETARTAAWWDITPVIDGLAEQPSDELRPRILELLEEPQPRLQRAALRLLARSPTPEALDQAWSLHTRMQNDPSAFLDSDEAPQQNQPRLAAYRLYDEAFDALRECSRLSPEWLVGRIQQADTNAEPVHDLAYLCANLNDDGKTWRRCKSVLFARVSSDHQRSLALNADVWSDTEVTDWLASVIDVEQDLLGPAALRALAQIDPIRAVSSLPRVPDKLLYFCRGWFLPRLFASVPTQANDELRRRILESDNQLRAGLVYSGNENRMDAQTFNVLLDALDAEIRQLLDETSLAGHSSVRDKCNGLFSVLEMLVRIGRSDLLDELNSRRGSHLEQGLVELLVEVMGPRKTLGPDSLARKPAIELLRRMGGPGHLRVVNAFLGAESQYGKLDAIQEAVTNHDGETLRKLSDIAIGDHSWNGHPLLQMEAMKAIAAAGDAPRLLVGAMHLGLHIPSDLNAWLRPQLTGREQAVEGAMAAIRRRQQSELPGAMAILGIFAHTQAVEEITTILSDPPDDNARLAAVIALGRMGEDANVAVELIRKQIEHDRCRHHTLVSLLRIGTPDARRAVIETLHPHWDLRFAISLSEYEDTRSAAIEQLKSRLRDEKSRSSGSWMDDAQVCLSAAPDDVLGEVLRGLPSLSDRVRETALASEGGLWIVGSKADAIRALAVLDPHTARLATAKVLTDRKARDRHLYPPLLYRLDSVKAREAFLDIAADESNAAVRWAMAYCLTSGDSSWLQEELIAKLAASRCAACQLSLAAAAGDDRLSGAIDMLLRDPASRVRDAAETVVEHCQRAIWIGALLDQMNHPRATEGRAWAVLDSLLAIADVGYSGTAFPAWVSRFLDTRPARDCPAMRLVLSKRLEERRKKALAEAERKAKRSG